MGRIRWGVIGCGKISSDFVGAVQHLKDPDNTVVAVVARSIESARKLAGKFNIKKYYAGYESLLEDKEVDAVYIGVVNAGHVAIAKVYLEAKIPILCEKPLCTNFADTKLLIDLAKKQQVFLMEATWTRIFPAYDALRDRLKRKTLGEIKHANISMGLEVYQSDRVRRSALGGGCVLDFGVYVLQFILLAMGDERPLEVKAFGDLNEEGCESEVTAMLRFSNNRYGTFFLSTHSVLPNRALYAGTKGSIEFEHPHWVPTKFTSSQGDSFECKLDPSTHNYEYEGSQGLKYEAVEAAKLINEGKLECMKNPHSTTLLIAELIEDIRRQVGVKI